MIKISHWSLEKRFKKILYGASPQTSAYSALSRGVQDNVAQTVKLLSKQQSAAVVDSSN